MGKQETNEDVQSIKLPVPKWTG